MRINKLKRFRGFTLIELLVVVVILGILATVGLTFFTSSQMRGRDAKRKSDLKQVAIALELYYSDYQFYPDSVNGDIAGCPSTTKDTCSWGSSAKFTDDKTTYMREVPGDPSSGSYYYRTVSVDGISNQGFQIYAKLENPQDINCLPGLDGKPNCTTPLLPPTNPPNCSGTCNYAVTSANVSPIDE
jgi:general secretion pathway protein G